MPLIAHVNIASSEFKADPFPFYAQLRSEAPVYRTMLPDKRNVWLVTRYDDVLAVLKDDRFSKDKINARTPPWLPGCSNHYCETCSMWMYPTIRGCVDWYRRSSRRV